jgi:hypothetical protein
MLTNSSTKTTRARPLSYTSIQMNSTYFVPRIKESEVKNVLKKMNEGKTMDLDRITIKVWRSLWDIVTDCLTELFNFIFWSNKMYDEWR